MIPKRRKPQKSGIPKGTEAISCRSHLQHVRGFVCLGAAKEPGKCLGGIEAHHVKTRGAGGGDEQVVPLCVFHHASVHTGWQSFEARHGINLERIAADIAWHSPHLRKLRLAKEAAE
jgi:hypothetical protein